MIYAAYAGTGKSYFCQEHPEAIDLICMPFKYTNFSDVSEQIKADRKEEQIKADQNLELRTFWELYYYWAVKYLLYYCPEQPIVIPTVGLILDFLEADHIPYTIVYPEKDLKDEYERRYRDRGNTEGFLDVFIGQWDDWIKSLEKRNTPFVKHIVLQRGQYLSDVVRCIYACDPYKLHQIEKFRQKLYRIQSDVFKGIVLKEDEPEFWKDDTIGAVFYLQPIGEDDIATDFVWLSSETQLRKLRDQYRHKDSDTVPELIFFELCHTEDGTCCKMRIEREMFTKQKQN